MKLRLSPPLLLLALVLIVIYHVASRATIGDNPTPREYTSADWIKSLPDTPGAILMPNIPEALELQGYSGFRLFARLPKIEAKPDDMLYYLFGYDTFEGRRGQEQLTAEGLGLKDILAAGGGESLSTPPQGLEFTVVHRRTKEGIDGYRRFGFVDHDGSGRTTGGDSYRINLGTHHLTGGGVHRPEIALDKKIYVGEIHGCLDTADGTMDQEHWKVVKWYFLLHVAPKRR